MSRFRRLIVPLSIVAVGSTAGTWLGVEMLTPKAGVGVSREDAPLRRLPADARNVNYYLRPPIAYYDFDTSEAGFAEFVRNWDLEWMDRREGTGWAAVYNHTTGQRGDVEVADGIFYGWWKDDAGWFVCYDRRTGRAYCNGNYR